MKLEAIKIKNFRTIDTELQVELQDGLTIVGPNSSGKTNILRAIEIFFTGFDNKYRYILSRDFPDKLDNGQTSLIASVLLEDSDIKAQSLLKQLNECLEQPKDITNKVNVYLTFSRTGNPIYRIFSGDKYQSEKKQQFNELQREFLLNFLDSFECHYVPSAKSINNLYDELLLPFIKMSIAQRLEEKINDIESGLKIISNVIDKQLESVGLGHIKSHFKIPENSLKKLFSSFEYHLSDPVLTEIERKGMGIQSAAMIASFKWISSEEKRQGRTPIWLIEEPESYLHPELSTACNSMLCSLSEEAHLVTTTHSLGFVPQDPRKLIGTKLHEGYTQIYKFDTYTGATKSIRDSLGVKFSDFCNLGLLNVFVEGKSDRELFKWVLDRIPIKATGKYTWDNIRNAELLDFGGTSALEGFMKATYEYVSKERPVVVVLDGDDAGDKTRKSLQQYLGNKGIEFKCNESFIILPKGFAIEGLFPHEWIIEANTSHPNWIKDFCTDINNQLMSFNTRDETTKSQLREFLKRKAADQKNEEWAKSFINLFEMIDHALEGQKFKLTNASRGTVNA
ncbi:DUF2813 domain-containing protein [Vibrio cholerae]|nr:DUF2813 domain-containing protein [Vibrio cholerae]